MDPQQQQPASLSATRRAFFRKILLRGIEGAEQTGRTLGRRFTRYLDAVPAAPNQGPPVGAIGATVWQSPRKPQALDTPIRFLRPPGALSESDFTQACSACAACVRACPAQSILLDLCPDSPTGGKPYIVARQSPCVICDDLSCMKACPTAALQLVAQRTDIDMGAAVVDHGRCLRQASGEDCRLCVNQCPIGHDALTLNDSGRVAVGPGCTGCGVCEWVCPTEPASIVVEPKLPAPAAPSAVPRGG
jgi:MauM/NapG family ferredoxin protein